ncbi:hypothetical protein EON63_02010 [archaeon]|nr:MAG: hypothetical protein EON63_02010 [archaeon]
MCSNKNCTHALDSNVHTNCKHACPVDVVKTRYLSDVSGQYRSILHCIQHTYSTDSLRGFFKVRSVGYVMDLHVLMLFTIDVFSNTI